LADSGDEEIEAAALDAIAMAQATPDEEDEEDDEDVGGDWIN
jgi:hypothetical protein